MYASDNVLLKVSVALPVLMQMVMSILASGAILTGEERERVPDRAASRKPRRHQVAQPQRVSDSFQLAFLEHISAREEGSNACSAPRDREMEFYARLWIAVPVFGGDKWSITGLICRVWHIGRAYSRAVWRRDSYGLNIRFGDATHMV